MHLFWYDHSVCRNLNQEDTVGTKICISACSLLHCVKYRKTETVSVPNNRKLNFISIWLTVQLLELFVYLLKTINPIKTGEKTIPQVWPNFCFKKVKKSALCVHWKKARKVYQNIFKAVLCGEWNYRRTPTPPQPHLVIFLNFKEFLLWICIAAVNRKKKQILLKELECQCFSIWNIRKRILFMLVFSF